MESAGLLPHGLCIVGNFRGWKLLQISLFFSYSWNFSLWNWGAWRPLAWQKQAIYEGLHCNNHFSPICDSFLPRKFPAIRYTSIQFKDIREIWNGFEVNVSWFMPCDVFLSGHFRPSSPSSGHLKFGSWIVNCGMYTVNCTCSITLPVFKWQPWNKSVITPV